MGSQPERLGAADGGPASRPGTPVTHSQPVAAQSQSVSQSQTVNQSVRQPVQSVSQSVTQSVSQSELSRGQLGLECVVCRLPLPATHRDSILA